MPPTFTAALLLALSSESPAIDTAVLLRRVDTVRPSVAGMAVVDTMAADTVMADTVVAVRFGAFVDGYLAYDGGRPRSLDRAFTTQASRHGEFNVNLAFVEAQLTGPRVRGRLAVQAGTSVQVNYAGEPRLGATSGPDPARLLQEAWAGYEVRPGLWVDAGIFFSNVGMEGWVSRENPTYTRSLVADYSPYYSSGVRATWQATPRLSLRADVVNGWQNISERNEDKSIGARLDFAASPSTTVSWYALGGREEGARLRLFNGVGIKSRLASSLELVAAVDAGREDGDSRAMTGVRTWHGGSAILRWSPTRTVAFHARAERYVDTDQVIVVTGAASGMRANGGSVGMDVQPALRLMWRAEARLVGNDGAIFPDRAAASGLSSHNFVLVTALSLRF